jgi:hypothetical protein
MFFDVTEAEREAAESARRLAAAELACAAAAHRSEDPFIKVTHPTR